MPADLACEFTGFRKETGNAPVVGLPKDLDSFMAEQLHKDIGRVVLISEKLLDCYP